MRKLALGEEEMTDLNLTVTRVTVSRHQGNACWLNDADQGDVHGQNAGIISS